jgi:uncharacterized Tic20 family protein
VDTQLSAPTSDERLLAALSHASIMLFGWGLVAPVIIWATNRAKSKYVRFQALQALGYQVFMTLFYLLLSLVVTIVMLVLVFLLIGIAVALNNDAFAIIATLLQFVILFAIFGMMGLYILGGIVAGAVCLAGKPFQYPFYGPWLERFLTPDETMGMEVQHV